MSCKPFSKTAWAVGAAVGFLLSAFVGFIQEKYAFRTVQLSTFHNPPVRDYLLFGSALNWFGLLLFFSTAGLAVYLYRARDKALYRGTADVDICIQPPFCIALGGVVALVSLLSYWHLYWFQSSISDSTIPMYPDVQAVISLARVATSVGGCIGGCILGFGLGGRVLRQNQI